MGHRVAGRLQARHDTDRARHVALRLRGFQLLDSIAVDGDGNVCVATLVTGAISVISPEGKMVEQIRVPKYDVFVTNICFGGPDLRTAYITSSGLGLLYATEWPVPGLRLSYNA